ncbi:MAG: hypothetical protein CM1200mP9_11800 [Gammaproteobacteria bacterium]|nr:MAG: hypothetical protein CM1200mP9_11800 [Gammaproteobacteria bacterium]
MVAYASLRRALCFLPIHLALVDVTLNEVTRWMAVAGFCIALVYPFMKRVTFFPQAILGIAFSWGIPKGLNRHTRGTQRPRLSVFPDERRLDHRLRYPVRHGRSPG